MYAIDFAQLGSNIQKIMTDRGITQQNMADELGISKQVMHKIVKGHKAINVNEISKMAAVPGTSVDELLMVSCENEAADKLRYMGDTQNEETPERVNLIRTAMDEIHLLGGLLDE